MKKSLDQNSPHSLQRARVRLRRVTQAAVVAATASTALIGLLVAQQHPGASSTNTSSSRTGSSSSTTTSTSRGTERDDDRSVNNNNDNDADRDVEVRHGDLGRYLT